MVEPSLNLTTIANSENSLQTHLEKINPSYRQAREIYNILISKTTNPLLRQGLADNTESFIIILLEKILRNTETSLEQNSNILAKVKSLEEEILHLKTDSLDSIVTAGNKISSDLKTFEIGFKDWNSKFDKFQSIFTTWDLGFKNFEENLEAVKKFLQDFSDYWGNKIELITKDLNKLENHIDHWNNDIISVNSSLDNLQKQFVEFKQRQVALSNRINLPIVGSSSSRQKFQTLPSQNNQWKL